MPCEGEGEGEGHDHEYEHGRVSVGARSRQGLEKGGYRCRLGWGAKLRLD